VVNPCGGPALSTHSDARSRGRRRIWLAVATCVLFTPAAAAAAVDGATTAGSLYQTTLYTGAQEFWKAGYTGAGVDVAVIDTGVASVPGLLATGKVVNGLDISFDATVTGLRYLDGYGHGTHMAAIIAGRDESVVAPYAGRKLDFLGMAPDARILNVRAGDGTGAVDVSQVIAAIDWVVAHRRDNGMNVRVLNLSYGVYSAQKYEDDPLAHAVENAWRNGIVVVVSGGNDGGVGFKKPNKPGKLVDTGLTSPAYDPYLIAVGATDTRGTATYSDDSMAPFSNFDDHRAPDLVAPGTSILSLRVPGSAADVEYGLTAGVDGRFFRGSGTSQAAAVVSGAAALLLQQRPSLTPDAVKALLKASATKIPLAGATYQGAGQLDLRRALLLATPANATQTHHLSNGRGKLELARGVDHLSMDGILLAGEKDVFGLPVSTAQWAVSRTQGTAWVGGLWNDREYTDIGWTGTSWAGRSWGGRSWTGRSWTGRSWTSSMWAGRSWTGRSWTTFMTPLAG
jgi:serine protease AprX